MDTAAPEKKMTPTDAMVKMIVAINCGREGEFYKIANEFAQSLASGGSSRYSIRNAISQMPLKMRRLEDMSHQLKGLLMVSTAKEENVYLSPVISEFINVLLSEWKHKDAYSLHNIPIRNKILLYGPTGNGKTTIARYIARASELPFVEINSDSVIDSHLGSTSSNIHRILNEMSEPCVLFWDEVDSIGYKRGNNSDSSAGRENDRMVNSMLTNVDRLNESIIFIGATNRAEVLDSAFLRRFDVRMEITAPSTVEKSKFVDQLLSYHQLPAECYYDDLTHLSSFSEIKTRIIEIGRAYLLRTTS